MSVEQVDAGWGRSAPTFAYTIENLHWREYLHLLTQTGVTQGTRYLDIACGTGLAVQLASEQGASVTGLDASPRLLALAAARTPQADLRLGDMYALPFAEASFDVATSFRGIWGNGLAALQEARRVVRPGGKVGLSFWGNQRRMQAYPLFAVLGQTTEHERANTSTLVSIGRPGVAEQLMADAGLLAGSRTALRLHWEFPDIETTARALASTGPAYLAMQHIGAEAFMASARAAAAEVYVAGLGVRAEVEVQFLVGTVPA
ncbi:MAG: class I SAM-dependent methyltransferase [Candidatus Tectimicrobiota bacterium]